MKKIRTNFSQENVEKKMVKGVESVSKKIINFALNFQMCSLC